MEASSNGTPGANRFFSKIRYSAANAISVASASAVGSRPSIVSGGLIINNSEIAKANIRLAYWPVQRKTRIPSRKYEPTEIKIPDRTSPNPVLLTSHNV